MVSALKSSKRGIVFDDIDAYVDRLAARGDAILEEIERKGIAEGWPIVGAAEGSFLHLLAKSLGARRVLELGTAIGYSGTWLARALPPGGELLTVEGNPDTAKMAQETFARTGVADRTRILVGPAQDVLADVQGPFDLIFNDIDKAGYPEVLDPCIERLRVGGLLVTDNVLWHGRVARGDRDVDTRAVRTYNERLAADPRMLSVILPLRDGVSVAIRIRP